MPPEDFEPQESESRSPRTVKRDLRLAHRRSRYAGKDQVFNNKIKLMTQWWIDENKVLGSSNPATHELEHLFQEGFRTIISLLDEGEQTPYYDVERIVAMGFDRRSIPMKDFTAPAQKQFMAFLNMMGQASGKVLIHCQGGYGRTGAMAAAYWIEKGLPAHEAVRKVRRLRPGALEIVEQEESLYDLEGYLLTLK